MTAIINNKKLNYKATDLFEDFKEIGLIFGYKDPNYSMLYFMKASQRCSLFN